MNILEHIFTIYVGAGGRPGGRRQTRGARGAGVRAGGRPGVRAGAGRTLAPLSSILAPGAGARAGGRAAGPSPLSDTILKSADPILSSNLISSADPILSYKLKMPIRTTCARFTGSRMVFGAGRRPAPNTGQKVIRSPISKFFLSVPACRSDPVRD